MKGLFVGVFKAGSTNVSQIEAFRRQGAEMDEFPYRDIAREKGRDVRDAELKSRASGYDFVFISKGNTIGAGVIGPGTKWILWYMDPMGNFNQELVAKIMRCHWSFFALQRPYEAARELTGNQGVSFLPEGFDPKVDRPMRGTGYDISFIGTLDKNRRAYLKAIPQIKHCFGYGADHARIASNSDINLNFVRGNDGCSDRVYKILAAGGFLLTQPWPNMEELFTPGKHLDTFTSPKDLNSKIIRYLADPEARKKISQAGMEHVQKYSRDNWAKAILEKV